MPEADPYLVSSAINELEINVLIDNLTPIKGVQSSLGTMILPFREHAQAQCRPGNASERWRRWPC